MLRMESPILLNSNLPIVIHAKTKNPNSAKEMSQARTTSSSSKAILRRPTIASSIDVINLSAPNSTSTTPTNTEAAFIATKSKLSTTQEQQQFYASLTNASSTAIFHANDSFYLHRGANNQNQIASNHKTFNVVSGEGSDSSSTESTTDAKTVDYKDVNSGAASLLNHTKSMFDNMKQEQQKVLEQANTYLSANQQTSITLEKMPTSISIISSSNGSDKPKKKVSFNENLLEVHLIPHNNNNSNNNDHHHHHWEQHEQTTYTHLTAPNIINTKKLMSNTKFYRTARPLLVRPSETPSTTSTTTPADLHLLNELRRYNSNLTQTLRSTSKSNSLSALNRSHSVINSRSSAITSASSSASNNSNTLSVNDINETLNDKNLFKLSIKTLKFNNNSGVNINSNISSNNGQTSSLTIQPVTENSIKSVMTIEPLNIKPKGFLYEQFQYQQQQNPKLQIPQQQQQQQLQLQQQQQNYFNEFASNLYTKYLNTSTLTNEYLQQQQQQQQRQNNNTSSSVVVNHYSENNSDKENHVKQPSNQIKKMRSTFTTATEDSSDEVLANKTNKQQAPFLLNESIPLYTNSLLISPSGLQNSMLNSSSSTLLLSPQTSSLTFNNANFQESLISKKPSYSNPQNSPTVNSNAASQSVKPNPIMNQQLIALRNANLLNNSPTSGSSSTSGTKKAEMSHNTNGYSQSPSNVHRHINFKPRNQSNNSSIITISNNGVIINSNNNNNVGNTTSTSQLTASDLRRTHSALPILLRNTNHKIHAYNSSLAAQSKFNAAKTPVQIPAATVVTSHSPIVIAQPQLSTLKRSGTFRINPNENF